jgi:hypothetical protein
MNLRSSDSSRAIHSPFSTLQLSPEYPRQGLDPILKDEPLREMIRLLRDLPFAILLQLCFSRVNKLRRQGESKMIES